jgi:phosphinothricin acetyltransferase
MIEERDALTVRACRLEDAAAIARIYNQGIEDRVATFETRLRTPEELAGVLAVSLPTHPYVVAESGGRVVGWAGTSPYRSRSCYEGVAEFSVYVDRAARGAGAGRASMRALIEACEKRGFWKLVSRIFPENTASLRLCASLGFREVGCYRRHGRLDGVWRDVVIVERLLGDAG